MMQPSNAGVSASAMQVLSTSLAWATLMDDLEGINFTLANQTLSASG
jgi:hypothetical protein